jgi:hypothetical protein
MIHCSAGGLVPVFAKDAFYKTQPGFLNGRIITKNDNREAARWKR